MISAIIDGITAIVDFFAMLFDVVVTLIKDIGTFVTQLVKLPDFLSTSLSFLPPVFLVGVGGILTIIILLRVLGRD